MVEKDKGPIVFFSSVTHFGGSVKSTIALIEEIKKKCDVMVLDVSGCCTEYINELEKLGITYEIILPKAKKMIIGGSSRISRLWRVLIAGGEIWRIVRQLRRKLEDINPQVICLNFQKSMFYVGRAVGKRFPTLMFVRIRYQKLKWYCLKDWRNLGVIVGNNSKTLKFFEQFDWARNKLAVAYNGIDFDAIQRTEAASKNLPGQDSSLKMLMPATLIPLKAHSVAIKGFAKFCRSHNDCIMWICGDTPNNLTLDYENSLHELCHKLGITDKVHFLGWCSNVPAIMKSADIMVLTSETEGLPRSLLEAMALGLPVIATKVGGITEVIRDDVDGILVDVGDDDAVATALERLQIAETRHKMGLAGQQRIKTEFSIKRQADVFLKLINKIVS